VVFQGELITETALVSMGLWLRAARGEEIEELGDWRKKLKLIEAEMRLSGREKIQKQLDFTVFTDLFDTSISTLLYEFIETYQEFNKFYFGPDHRIYYNSNQIVATTESPKKILESLSSHTHDKSKYQEFNNKINISLAFGAYIDGGPNAPGCQYNAEIVFERIKYYMTIPDTIGQKSHTSKLAFEKLYHQSISEAEIIEIRESLGILLTNHIENIKNRNK
jgi:hypothetical protein